MCWRCFTFRSVVLCSRCVGGHLCVLGGECCRAGGGVYVVRSVCGCSCWEGVCVVSSFDGSGPAGFGV